MTAPEMKSGRAVGNIEHDGTFFAHDKPVTLPAEVFDRLFDLGAIAIDAVATAPVEDAPTAQELIVAAIQSLPPEGFGPDQAPLLDAVKAVLPEGAKVTKASLAKAWETLKGV